MDETTKQEITRLCEEQVELDMAKCAKCFYNQKGGYCEIHDHIPNPEEIARCDGNTDYGGRIEGKGVD